MKLSKILPFLLIAAFCMGPYAAIADEYIDAETLKEEASLRWQNEYTDHYGRKIRIDVLPLFPDIHSVPIWRVEPAPITEESIYSVCDESLTACVVEDERTVYEYSNPSTNEEMKMIIPTQGAQSFFITYTDLSAKIQEDPNQLESFNGVHYLPNEADWTHPYFENSTMTIQSCLEWATARIGEFYPEVDLQFDLMWVEVVHNSRPCYVCTLRQSLYGIPILMSAYDPVLFLNDADVGFKLPDSWKYGETFQWGDFTRPFWDFTAFTDGGFGFQFSPLMEVEKIAEDIPLSHFHNVIESIEKRIMTGNIRTIHSLRFGYCCFFNETGESVLYPIWQIECDFFYNPKEELRAHREQDDCPVTSRLNYRTMIVNAQTGEFMDPLELKDKLLDCPAIITWEDVQRF